MFSFLIKSVANLIIYNLRDKSDSGLGDIPEVFMFVIFQFEVLANLWVLTKFGCETENIETESTSLSRAGLSQVMLLFRFFIV